MLQVIILNEQSDPVQIKVKTNSETLPQFSSFISELKQKLNIKGKKDKYVLKTSGDDPIVIDEHNFIFVISKSYESNMLFLTYNKEETKNEPPEMNNQPINNSSNEENEKNVSYINKETYDISKSKEDKEETEEINTEKNDTNINNNDNSFFLFQKQQFNNEEESIDMTPIEIINNENERKVSLFYRFTTEQCSICNSRLEEVKFTCCICEQCTLCDICEQDHPHPCFVYKSFFLSNLKDTYFYIQSKQDMPMSSFSMRGFFSRELEVSIEPEVDSEISIRPNNSISVPFNVKNLSNYDIEKDELFIYARNFKNVSIIPEQNHINKTINSKGSLIVNLTVKSKYILCREDIIIELYSPNKWIKEGSKKRCKFTIEVNEDTDEENINNYFKSQKSLLLRKKYKEILVNIWNDGLSTKEFNYLYNQLKKYNWDISKALPYLLEAEDIKNNVKLK